MILIQRDLRMTAGGGAKFRDTPNLKSLAFYACYKPEEQPQHLVALPSSSVYQTFKFTSKYAFLRPSNYCHLLCAELDRIIAFMQSLYLFAPARTTFGFFDRKLVAVAIHPIHGPFQQLLILASQEIPGHVDFTISFQSID